MGLLYYTYKSWKRGRSIRTLWGRWIIPLEPKDFIDRQLWGWKFFTYGCLGSLMVRDFNPHIFSLSIPYFYSMFVAEGFALNPSDWFLSTIILLYLKSLSIHYCYNNWIMICILFVLLMCFDMCCWIKVIKSQRIPKFHVFLKINLNEVNK